MHILKLYCYEVSYSTVLVCFEKGKDFNLLGLTNKNSEMVIFFNYFMLLSYLFCDLLLSSDLAWLNVLNECTVIGLLDIIATDIQDDCCVTSLHGAASFL
jgi:hypothetical protein